MIKCNNCNNSIQDHFTREDVNEYKCRDCGEFTIDNEYIDIEIEETETDIFCEIALEVEG